MSSKRVALKKFRKIKEEVFLYLLLYVQNGDDRKAFGEA